MPDIKRNNSKNRVVIKSNRRDAVVCAFRVN